MAGTQSPVGLGDAFAARASCACLRPLEVHIPWVARYLPDDSEPTVGPLAVHISMCRLSWRASRRPWPAYLPSIARHGHEQGARRDLAQLQEGPGNTEYT